MSATSETVQHLHAAMRWDFRLLILVTVIQTALIIWNIYYRRRP